MFEIKIKEQRLTGIKTPEQLAAFVISSLGLSELRDDRDVRMLLAFMDHKEGLRVPELKKIAGLGQTATYAKIKKFVNAGLIYKGKGAIYRLKERTLKDTLDFRVKRDIDKALSAIIDIAAELDAKLINKGNKR
ncbi:MAG: hypothetical protein GOU99_02045 [Candidatus Altiarchaeota archaeon]|nr:hypothetical protein [Candidatus Altiarchaeota archaeon]